MKYYECGTLVPGCDWRIDDESEAEIVRRAVEHMKSAHGEQKVRENMVDNIKQRIKTAKQEA